eukprot:985045-Amphidinium_carterae.1
MLSVLLLQPARLALRLFVRCPSHYYLLICPIWDATPCLQARPATVLSIDSKFQKRMVVLLTLTITIATKCAGVCRQLALYK